MSSNPELPVSNQSTDDVPVPHSGNLEPGMREFPVVEGLPQLTEEEVNSTTSADTAYENFGGEQVTLSPAEKAAFDQYRRDVAISHNAAPEKKSKKKLAWIGGAVAGIVLAGGAIFTTNAGAEKNTPPTPVETSVAANPNATQQPEISATPQPTAEVVAGVAPEDLKFYNADGTFQTRKEVIDNVKVSPVEYKTVNDTFDAIFGRIEAAINYIPDEKTVRNNLNIPTEPLTIENYQKVAEDFQAITFDTVLRGDGKLRTTFENIGRDTAYARLLTWGDKEPVLYGIHITQDLIKSQKINITDNSTLNSIDDNASRNIGEYRIKSTSVNDLAVPLVPENEDPNTYKPTWQLAGSIDTVKVG
jgi:hypothetical protein